MPVPSACAPDVQLQMSAPLMRTILQFPMLNAFNTHLGLWLRVYGKENSAQESK